MPPSSVSIGSASFFENVLACVDDAVVATNSDQRILYLNRAAERLYTVVASEAMGRPLRSIYESLWGDFAVETQARESLARDGRWRGELIHRTWNGVDLHVESTVSALHDAAGKSVGQLAVSRDITLRKRAEASLREHEQRLSLALAGSSVSVWSEDRDLRITWVCNPPHPWRTADLLGKSAADLLPPQEVERMTAIKRRVIKSGQRESTSIEIAPGPEIRCWDLVFEPARDSGGAIIGIMGAGTDVTERKRTEEALRESESRFRSTFENAAVGIAHVDLDGRWMRVNQVVCDVLGYRREELVGHTFQEFTHPHDLAVDLHNKQRLMSGEIGTFSMEKRYRRSDGSWVWACITVSLVRDDSGRPMHFIAAIEDITERKRAVEEISRQRAAFMRLAENSPDLIVRFDRNGRMWYINSQTERVFGVPRAHLLGHTMAEVGAPAELCIQWQETLASVGASGVQSLLDLTIEREGEPVVFSAICVPEFDENGRVATVLSIARDVTELKRAIQQARDRQERLNLAVSAANLGVFEWGLISGLVRLENAVAREILGQPADANEITAAALLSERVHPDDVELLRQRLAQISVSHGTFNHVCRLRPPGAASDRWVEFAGRCEAAGSPGEFRLVGFISDITERVEAAAALARARDEAEAASRAKDRFLATLSHELRTPLTPALMVSSELEHSPSVPPELRQECTTIRANIELEARLIDDLLDIARISQGKLHMEFARCDAHLVLQRSVETTEIDFSHKQISLGWHLNADRSQVHGDAVRLQQVFWNLLRNAAKFTPAGGHVSLRTRTDGAAWRLEVADNGVGIPRADLGKVFDSFVQLEDGPRSGQGGLGLGLAISVSIVREHGGRIWAESAGLGHGATFIVELPLASQQAPAHVAEPAASRYAARRLRILVVEDHGPSREAFVALLRRRGHDAVGAEGVGQARATAAARPFDLVISDLGLPDGSGLELMQSLSREHGLKGIALSGYGMESDIKASLDAGFLLHLTKPVTLHRLEEAVARVTGMLDDTPGR